MNRFSPAAARLALVVLCCGLLVLAAFVVARRTNHILRSEKVERTVMAFLRENNLPADGLLSRRRRGIELWNEYRREVALPEGGDGGKLVRELENRLVPCGVRVESRPAGEKQMVTVREGDKVFSLIEITVPPPPPPPEKPPAGLVALVLDDAGYSPDLSAFFDLGIPLTFAVLPHERYSRQVADELTKRRMPFILHLPLEPEGYPAVDPGKAALLRTMSTEQVIAKLESDLRSVPGVSGVSNHMGSAYSADEARMRELLQLLKDRGLFYFDSYTTPKTKARRAARAVEVRFLANELFVDLKDDPEYMKGRFEALLVKARRYGRAIGIGHVHKKSIIPALREIIPRYEEEGVRFVYLAEFLDEQPGTSETATIAKTNAHAKRHNPRH